MIGGRSVVAVVPARGGSKGVPGKNLRVVAGRSLLEWAVVAAQGAEAVDRVVVSTDDAAIAAEAERLGAEVPFLRDPALAGDATPMADVVLDLLGRIEADWVVLLQPTSPLRTSADIDAALALAFERGASSCISLCEAASHPAWMATVGDDRTMRPVVDGEMPTRRQDLEPVYARNGAIAAFSAAWFREARRFADERTVAYVMPPERSVDIDSELDLVVAEALLSTRDV